MISYDVKSEKDISVTRAVGRFFGHIWGAATRPVPNDDSQSQSHVINHEINEIEGELNTKKVILRRTTIDEVEIREEEL